MTAFNKVTPDSSNELVTKINNQDTIDLITIKENGKVSARNLYKFLELSPAVISRWLDSKIINNEYAFEDEDWWGFNIVVEGNKIKDYDLTPNFAKKLCMMSKSQKGEKARDYFLKCEQLSKNKLELTNPTDIVRFALQQLEAKDKEIKNLEEKLDESLLYISIIKVAKHNKISEKYFNWRLLKPKSIELGYDIKKAIDPIFGERNLYHVDIFKEVYPAYNYDFSIDTNENNLRLN